MHLPLLPFNLVAVHGKAHSFGLGDDQRFQILAFLNPVVFLHEVGQEFGAFTRRESDVFRAILGSEGERGGS